MKLETDCCSALNEDELGRAFEGIQVEVKEADFV
jgi:hypothetical protein